jgi:predicted TIM-barrel fold metal-dependent hydrolase
MTSTLDAMSARTIDKAKVSADSVPTFMVSADSHVDEPFDLWNDVPAKLRDQLPPRRTLENRPKGGMDPKLRIADMDLDGVAAEILYPSACLWYYDKPVEVQEAIFRVYNDWLADYCKTAPKRLFGVSLIQLYDIDKAIKEMQRCADLGMVGVMVWREPHPDLPFTHATHYEKFWAAAAEMGQPVNFHTHTGFNYHKKKASGIEQIRQSVNLKTHDSVNAMFDLLWSGACDRHPKIKFEFVEAEIGWIPFIVQQWDYYYGRYTRNDKYRQEFPITRKPSEIFVANFYATFMDDYVGSQALTYWGERNCLWSSDYPHPNMTWPNSRAFLARAIGELPTEKKKRLLSENVIELYGLKL